MEALFRKLTSILSTSQATYDDLNEVITLYPNATDLIFFQTNHIDTISIQNNGIQIDVNTLNFKFYWDNNEFLKKYINVVNFRNHHILIFNTGSSNFFLQNIGQEFIELALSNTYFFSNAFTYITFLNKLKEKSNSADDNFHFIDNYDQSSNKFLITSSKEPGKLILPISSEIAHVSHNIDKSKILEIFDITFHPNNKNLPIFLKNEIYLQLKSITENDRVNYLFENFIDISRYAEKNFEVFIHDLSIENLKKDFIEYKNKYFLILRDILSKLTNQIVGLPVAISAAIFGAYKVTEGDKITLSIILLVFLMYSIYTLILLKLQMEDIEDIKHNVNDEFEKLKDNLFFKKFNEELTHFEKVKSQLLNRTQSLVNAVHFYFTVHTLSSVLFLLYIEDQIKLPLSFNLISAIILVLLMAFIFYFSKHKDTVKSKNLNEH